MKIAIAIAVLVVATSSRAGDLEDVNAAADRLRAAFNEPSAEAAALFAAESFLGYFDPIPVLNQGRAGFKQFLAGQIQATESAQMIPYGPRTTQVTGTTAVIAQQELFVWKPIGGGAESMFTNSLQTWTKTADGWELTGWVTTVLPHGTAP